MTVEAQWPCPNCGSETHETPGSEGLCRHCKTCGCTWWAPEYWNTDIVADDGEQGEA